MIVGIDISKLTFDAIFLPETNKEKHKTFSNDEKGFKLFKQWLQCIDAMNAHTCMEATGRYGEEFSLFLSQQNIKVSVVNPTRIKAFARSEGVRAKTDKKDAGIIARFCKAHCPEMWIPPSDHVQELRDLYRCRQSLIDDKLRCQNRMEKLKTTKPSFAIWEKKVEFYKKDIKDVENNIKQLINTNEALRKDAELLSSIIGIGDQAAIALLSELPDIKMFNTAREVAAFAGLTPSVRKSGTSVHGNGSLSKIGSSSLRKALYMPALTAIRYNPILKDFYERLIKKGKKKMVALAAVMRKLLHIIFGLLKHQKPFRYEV